MMRELLQNMERNPKLALLYMSRAEIKKLNPLKVGDEYKNDPEEACRVIIDKHSEVLS